MSLHNYKSIATISLSGNLLEKLDAISNAGFDGIELCESDLLAFSGSPEYLARVTKEFGLKILLFQPFRNFEGSPRLDIQKKLNLAKQKFGLMNELGVSTMLVCSNVEPNTIKNDEVIIDDLSNLTECAHQYGIKVGYEALSWGTYVKSYRHAWKIIESVNHPSFGLILDSFHTLAIKDNIFEIPKLKEDKIFFVQLADAPYLNMKLLEWSRHFRCYPGEGEFNVNEFVSLLLKTGYQGPLSLEIFSDKLQSTSPRVAAFNGMLSIRELENNIYN